MDRIELDEASRLLNEEREKLLARLTEEREDLTRIESALARIDAGTYGLCLSCDEPIEEMRLISSPDAELCVACATLLGPDPWVPDGLYW